MQSRYLVGVLALGLAVLSTGCGSSSNAPGETPVESQISAPAQPDDQTTAPPGEQLLPETTGDAPFYLETAEVRVAESDPVQLFLDVKGDAPTPGHAVAYTVERSGDRIVVEITTQPGADAAAQVLDPRSFSIPLGPSELPVTVDVNDGQVIVSVDA